MSERFLKVAIVSFVVVFISCLYQYSTDPPSEIDLQTLSQISYIDAAISSATFAGAFSLLIPGSVLIFQFLFKEKNWIFFYIFGGEIGAMLGQGAYSIWWGVPVVYTLVIVTTEIIFVIINYRIALSLYRSRYPR